MTGKIKALGLAFVAAFAMSAITAAAAHAIEFKAEANPTFLHGEAKNVTVFDFKAGSVKCTVTYSGKLSGGAEKELTIIPKYSGCMGFGQNATITGFATGECDYRLLQPTGTNNPFDGKVKIFCENGKDILIEVPMLACSVTIEANQEPANVFEYENQGLGMARDVLVTPKLEAIKYKALGTLGSCGTLNETREDGKLTGAVTLKGFRNAGLTEQSALFLE